MSFCCSSTLVSYSLLLDDFRLGAFLYESRSLFRALTSLVNDLFSSFRFFTVCRLSFSLCSSILIFCSSLITSTFFTWRFLYMSILVASSFLTLFLSMCTLSLFVDIESFNIRISSFLLLMSCTMEQLSSSRDLSLILSPTIAVISPLFPVPCFYMIKSTFSSVLWKLVWLRSLLPPICYCTIGSCCHFTSWPYSTSIFFTFLFEVLPTC